MIKENDREELKRSLQMKGGEQEVKDFIAGDPANKINSYEYYPMLAVVPEE